MRVAGKTGWIGVDVGTHAVKLAQVERRGAGWHLVEALIVRRRDPWQGDESSLEPLSSSDEIRAGLALGRGFKDRRAALVLSMALCDSRGVQIEKGSEAECRAAVARELDKLYAQAAESRAFDYWHVPLPGDHSPGSENTVIFSLPRTWAQQIAEDLVECRLAGQSLDALPLALARAVAMAPGTAAETIAAIDWGCQRATLCIVHRGVAAFVRCLREAGFAQITATVCKALSVSADEAQNLLVEQGLSLPGENTHGQLSSVMEEVTAKPRAAFVEEVQRTLLYLRQQRRALVPSRVMLFGAGAVVRHMAACLTRKLDLPVNVWSLAGDSATPQRERAIPAALLGPSIALSSLAWA